LPDSLQIQPTLPKLWRLSRHEKLAQCKKLGNREPFIGVVAIQDTNPATLETVTLVADTKSLRSVIVILY